MRIAITRHRCRGRSSRWCSPPERSRRRRPRRLWLAVPAFAGTGSRATRRRHGSCGRSCPFPGWRSIEALHAVPRRDLPVRHDLDGHPARRSATRRSPPSPLLHARSPTRRARGVLTLGAGETTSSTASSPGPRMDGAYTVPGPAREDEQRSPAGSIPFQCRGNILKVRLPRFASLNWITLHADLEAWARCARIPTERDRDRSRALDQMRQRAADLVPAEPSQRGPGARRSRQGRRCSTTPVPRRR